MDDRCEVMRANPKRSWSVSLVRCKRNATIKVGGRNLCEQHAKMALGLPADVHVSTRDAL
jgi:hypothetical protein